MFKRKDLHAATFYGPGVQVRVSLAGAAIVHCTAAPAFRAGYLVALRAPTLYGPDGRTMRLSPTQWAWLGAVESEVCTEAGIAEG